MQTLTTYLLLAALAAPLVYGNTPHGRRKQLQRHQHGLRCQDWQPWSSSGRSGTYYPTESRPCSGFTSVVTVYTTVNSGESYTAATSETTKTPSPAITSQPPAPPSKAGTDPQSSNAVTATSTSSTIAPAIPTSINPSFVSIPTISYTSPSPSDQSVASSQPVPQYSTPAPAQPSPSYPTSNSTCSPESRHASNFTKIEPYYGLNVVNTKPFDPSKAPSGSAFKAKDDWRSALQLIKTTFPQANAVRMYSTTDSDATGVVPHLMNAMDAAIEQKLKILVGLWSGGEATLERFEQEVDALEEVVKQYGCDNMAAVSVGTEDLNDLNHGGFADQDQLNGAKQRLAGLLVAQMQRARSMLRGQGCCSVPVTHTETWNELTNLENPEVNQVIANADQAIIANIFPYWGNVTVVESWQMNIDQAWVTQTAANSFNKDLWLGESGWPQTQTDPSKQNIHGTTVHDAQTYWDFFGCQIMNGTGTGFYYVDWDQDAPYQDKPSFGLFDHNGNALLDLRCEKWKPDMRVKKELPGFMGGKGIALKEGLP